MTLDAAKPADSDLISTYAGYLRETRTQVNTNITDIAAAGSITVVSNVTISGQTTLTVGTELNAVPLEVINITAIGSETLNNILGATEGQIKVFHVLSGTITFADDDTKFSNNGDRDLDALTGDVIAYENINGDGAGTNGYWHEIFRTLRS